MHRLIGLAHMQRLGIGIRINRNGTNAHRPRGADDAASDFAPVGDEEGLDHAKSSPERGGGPEGVGGVPPVRFALLPIAGPPPSRLRRATSPFRGGFVALHASTIAITQPSILFSTS